MEIESLLWLAIKSPIFTALLLRSVHCGFQVFIIIEGISLESLTPFRCSYQPAYIVGLVGYFPRPRFSVKTAGFGCVFGAANWSSFPVAVLKGDVVFSEHS